MEYVGATDHNNWHKTLQMYLYHTGCLVDITKLTVCLMFLELSGLTESLSGAFEINVGEFFIFFEFFTICSIKQLNI